MWQIHAEYGHHEKGGGADMHACSECGGIMKRGRGRHACVQRVFVVAQHGSCGGAMKSVGTMRSVGAMKSWGAVGRSGSPACMHRIGAA
eukprot:365461-Chlamydomonas_euryale.AAC.8